MSDISITITADPNQAVKGIEKVSAATKGLERSAESANRSLAASADVASRSLGRTISVSGSLGGELKEVGRAASGITSALGESVPVIGRMGSALSSLVAGPLGIISAAIAAAGIAIQKLVQDAQDRIERLKQSAAARSSSAYDTLMKGRQDYADQLKVVGQVRELQAVARRNGLSREELAQFRGLASQLGIDQSAVTATGIKGTRLDDAVAKLRQQRIHYANQEYTDYAESMQRQLRLAVKESGLADSDKRRLSQMSIQSMAESITARARSGAGTSLDEFKAWQDLYGLVKQFNEVRESYNRDAMLGRSQADLNAAAVAGITSAHPQQASSGSGSGSALPGTLAWQREQDQKAIAEQQKREDIWNKTLLSMNQDLSVQELVTANRKKEAYMLEQRIRVESSMGQKLTAVQAQELDALSARLYDLRNPAADLEESPLSPSPSASGRRTAAPDLHLDRLQRIGANVTNPVASSEKAVLDQSLLVQRDIRTYVQAILGSPTSTMRF